MISAVIEPIEGGTSAALGAVVEPVASGASAANSAVIAPVSAGTSTVAGPEEIAGRLFVAVARLIRRIRHDDPTPLGPGAISALGTIVSEGPIRLGDLASVEGVRAPTMTRIVDALVSDGNAERIPDPGDGRACLVRATEAGSGVIAGARSARSRALVARMAQLDAAQRESLILALPALEALCADDAELKLRPSDA